MENFNISKVQFITIFSLMVSAFLCPVQELCVHPKVTILSSKNSVILAFMFVKKKAFLAALFRLNALVENQLTISVWTCFWEIFLFSSKNFMVLLLHLGP